MKKFNALLALAFVAFSPSVCWSANRIIDISDSEKVQVYDEPGSFTWIAPNNLTGTAQLLVVGGGGAGGAIKGGGGGGGQVIYTNDVTLTAGASYTVTVADGGAVVVNNRGGNGGDSSFSDSGFTTITAVGGGGGGGGYSAWDGKDGANGGGAGSNNKGTAYSGGNPTVEGGHKGGDCPGNSWWDMAGGGGMTEDGYPYNDSSNPGYGGAGATYSITGEEKMYGYGGGGGTDKAQVALSGARNEWGCGAGYGATYVSTPGEEGTGGGGGGGYPGGGASDSSDGGSGTVIIRYMLDTSLDDFSADITSSLRVPTTVTFTAVLGTELSTMTWNFGDGSEEVQTTELSVQHEYTAEGVYTVTMTRGSKTVTKTGYIEMIAGVLYVDAASTNPTPPYNTRATAATEVNDAMAYAQDGFEVRIAPGDYPLTNVTSSGTVYIDVTNAVTVIGEGDTPTNVILRSTRRRPWFNDKVMRVNNASAKVVNVTLADGSVSNGGWGGCLLIDNNGGVVSNCVIRNGWAENPVQARAGGAYLNNGLVTHTIFEDCKFSGTQMSNVPMTSAASVNGSARIENCLFRNCTGEVGVVVAVQNNKASMSNCTVVDSQIGCWTGNSNVTNDGYAICCTAGSVKNCAVYNVKRLAYLDREETYDATFGSDASKFTSCVKAEKSDFADCDNGDLVPKAGGALYNKGTTIDGFAGIKDLAGNPRVFGRAIDVGCYESQFRSGFLILVR